MSRVAIVAAMLFSICAWAPRPVVAQSGIHRCVGANGESIFTDQACSDLHATDRPKDNLVHDGPRVVIARTCARKPDELLFDVRNALAAQDVNRFAGSYLWTGMGSREAYSLMDRLVKFSARPLIDVQLVSSVPEPDPYAYAPEPEFDMPGFDFANPEQEPPPVREPPLDMIRIDQTRSAKDAETATSYMRIVPAAGCLWVSF
jgi:hypothetical protein